MNSLEHTQPPRGGRKSILLISPRGFCAGVERAIETVEQALEILDTPLYVHHEIVHNRRVVENLAKRGIVFIDRLDEMPDNLPVIFSAHGVSPAVREKARQKNLTVIDGTCPLVAKVHLEAIRYAREGYHIFFIGHKNHAETIGTQGEAPDHISVIENETQIKALEEKIAFLKKEGKDLFPYHKTAYLTQTTLSVGETEQMIRQLQDIFPDIRGPSAGDICYATTNRQEALSLAAPESDLFLIVGSANSSNSNRLREQAEKNGKPAYLIDSAEMVQAKWLAGKTHIAITAGASAPEDLVKEIIERLQSEFGFDEIINMEGKPENTRFQLPQELQKLLTQGGLSS